MTDVNQPSGTDGVRASWGATLRAAFIAVHFVAIAMQAFPSPGNGLVRSAWQDPTVQAEFEAWAGHLSRVGIAWTPAELEERAWVFAEGYQSVRSALLAPFDPYYRYMGTWQSWRMFVAPHRYPTRLSIDADRGAGFEPLFEERSSTATWRRHQLDHDRMRASIFRYGWRSYRVSYREFGQWVARQAAADDPTIRRVRLRMLKYRTLSAAEVRAGAVIDGEWQDELVLVAVQP